MGTFGPTFFGLFFFSLFKEKVGQTLFYLSSKIKSSLFIISKKKKELGKMLSRVAYVELFASLLKRIGLRFLSTVCFTQCY